VANDRFQVRIPNSEVRMANSLRTVVTPSPRPLPRLRQGFGAQAEEREKRSAPCGWGVERFGSSSRRQEGSRKVRTATESPNGVNEVRDLRTFKAGD